jgi:hypothetical protein
MSWNVENTDEFGAWWNDLTEVQQEDITATVTLLEQKGPNLPFPYSYADRVFYAFDPRRTAILLIGGDKTGDDRFYEKMIPVADKLYDVYIEETRKEGLIR